jgi:hypothetical protein
LNIGHCDGRCHGLPLLWISGGYQTRAKLFNHLQRAASAAHIIFNMEFETATFTHEGYVKKWIEDRGFGFLAVVTKRRTRRVSAHFRSKSLWDSEHQRKLPRDVQRDA